MRINQGPDRQARPLTQHNIETVLLRALERNELYGVIWQGTSTRSATAICVAFDYQAAPVR